MVNVNKIKECLLKRILQYEAFKDPLTNSYPKNEIQLSAVLGSLLQQNRIDLSEVKLHPVDCECIFDFTKRLIDIVDYSAVVLNEFPLFTTSNGNISHWEGITADIAILNASSAIFIENKIGSSFASDGAQLKKQVEFLSNTENKENFLIILSSKEFFAKGLYKKELNDALKLSNTTGFLVFWEEIFEASSATPIVDTINKKQNILEFAEVRISIPFELNDDSFITCSSKGRLEYVSSNQKEKSIYSDMCKHLTEDFMRWHEKELLLHFDKNVSYLYNINIEKMLCEGKDIDYSSIELYNDDRKLNLPDISLYARMIYPRFYNEGATVIVSGDLEYADAQRFDKIFDIKKYSEPN